MKYYYAIFKTTSEAVEVSFPDLEGCVSFGKSWEDALEHATDVLAAWLANADPSFVKKPSSHSVLAKKLKRGEAIVPIFVDSEIMESYQTLKRFNVIFPKEVLNQIDDYREKVGLKRSKLLQLAAKEYIHNHSNSFNASSAAH